MELTQGKTYMNKQTKRKVIILGRLDTIARENCLICEDITYGLILPILNEDPNNWELIENAPQIKDLIKGVSKYGE